MVITALFGARDELLEPTVINPRCRYVCFTDREFSSPIWEIVHVTPTTASGRRASRPFKITPHKFVDAEYSLWLDATIAIAVDPEEFVERQLASGDIAAYRHPYRDCAYVECVVCVDMGLDDPRVIAAQARRYLELGLPRHAGLFECGVLVRRHTQRMASFNDTWWAEYCAGSNRDQMSFAYSVWRTGIEVDVIPGNVRQSTDFQFVGHTGPRLGRFDESFATEAQLEEMQRAREYVEGFRTPL